VRWTALPDINVQRAKTLAVGHARMPAGLCDNRMILWSDSELKSCDIANVPADDLALVAELAHAVQRSSIHAPILARMLQPAAPQRGARLAAPPADRYDASRWSALLEALHAPAALFGARAEAFVACNLEAAAAAAEAALVATAFAEALQRLVTVATVVPEARPMAAELLLPSTVRSVVAEASAAARAATSARAAGANQTRGGLFADSGTMRDADSQRESPRSAFSDAMAAAWGEADASSPTARSPLHAHTSARLSASRDACTPGEDASAVPWLPVQLTAWGSAAAGAQRAAHLLGMRGGQAPERAR
jgi:hypothetical protein